MRRKRKQRDKSRATLRTTTTNPTSRSQQQSQNQKLATRARSATASSNSEATPQTEKAKTPPQSNIIRLEAVGQTRLYNLGQFLKQKREHLKMTKREAVDGFSNALIQLGVTDYSRDNDWLNRVERSNQRLEPAELWALLITYKCDEAEKIQVLSSYGFLDCFSPDPRHRQIMAIFGRVYFDIIANERISTALADLIERDPNLTLGPGDCLGILSSAVSLLGNPLPTKAIVLPQSQIRRV